jgi:hypothetical protein
MKMYFRIGLFVLVVIFLAGTVSAEMEFDNVGSYDEQTKTMTIKDNFGFGGTLAEITLNSPQNMNVIRGKDRLVAEFTIKNNGEYDNVFNNLEFYNMKDNGKGFTRGFQYKYKEYKQETRTEYDLICDDYFEYVNCIKENFRNITYQIHEWKPLNHKAILPSGDWELGIFVDVLSDEVVEWIPTFYGVEINEWATWTEALSVDIMAYNSFNESSGTNARDGVNDTHNFTTFNTPTWDTGLIGNALHFDGSSEYALQSNNITFFNANRTLNFWFNLDSSDAGDHQRVLGRYSAGGVGELQTVVLQSTTNYRVQYAQSNGTAIVFADQDTGTDWVMITFQVNNTHLRLYINATHIATYGYDGTSTHQALNTSIGARSSGIDDWFDGLIDEFGIWDRLLTDAEVTQLFNGGSGITYDASPPSAPVITVNLLAPADTHQQTNPDIELQANSTITNGNLTNTTAYLWFPNGTLHTTNTTTITGTVSNLTNNSFTDISPAQSYIWNFYSCGDNSTGWVTCGFSTSNRTFNITPFTENSQTFNAVTTEGNTELYTINVTILSGFQVETARLWYNGTIYDPLIYNQANDVVILNRSLVVPDVSATGNNTVLWEISLDVGSPLNSSSSNQLVNPITLDDCGTNTFRVLNYTMFQETSKALMVTATYNSTIELDVDIYSSDRSVQIINFSQDYGEVNNASVCLNANFNASQYSLDAQAKYDADDFAQEYYHIQNLTLTNTTVPKNISLYDINESLSDEFIISYKDASFIAVPDAIIQIQRKYVGEGLFRTVEAPKTDAQGETMGHLVEDDVIYTFIIVKNGEVLATFSNVIAVCENILTDDCEINLNSFSSHVEPEQYTSLSDFTYTLSYTESTREVESIFTIPSGSASEVMLNVTLVDNIGTREACSDSLISSSGTLTCIVPTNVGNGTVVAKITKDGSLMGEGYIKLEQEPEDIFGASLIFLSLFLYLTLIGVAISDNPLVTGFFFVIGALLGIALNVVDATGYIGAGATVLWLIMAILIVLIKGARRS